MIKFLFLKIIRFFYRQLSKIIYFLVPVISKILIAFRLNARIINQFNQLRTSSNNTQDHRSLISKLLMNKKLFALDIGAQGGFFNASILTFLIY